MGDRLTPTRRLDRNRPAQRAKQFVEVEPGFGRCFEVAFMTCQTHAPLFSPYG